jgi:ElaB/YqjD/DUF883 family membrane-anchored ribosome-binding protein
MNRTQSLHPVEYDAEELKDDIQRLLRATGNIADDTIVKARKRLSETFGRAGEAYEHGSKRALYLVRGHAVETAALALLMGVAAGFLLTRRFD